MQRSQGTNWKYLESQLAHAHPQTRQVITRCRHQRSPLHETQQNPYLNFNNDLWFLEHIIKRISLFRFLKLFMWQMVKDIRMVDPESVIEPVVAVILLQHLLISDLQESHVLLIYAFIPDVVQNGHLLEL